jgi:hypothetical protein
MPPGTTQGRSLTRETGLARLDAPQTLCEALPGLEGQEERRHSSRLVVAPAPVHLLASGLSPVQPARYLK